jgi:membrane peptidoglycan carboxypeptidase
MSAYLHEFPDGDAQKVFCGNGAQEFFGRIVHDHEKYAWLTVPEVIKYSSNIGMVNLLLKVEQEKMYKEFTRFGFGRPTGCDLPGEASGLLRGTKDWDNTTLTSIPYGQEVAVTPMQLMRAYAIIANGGYDVKPHVVDRIEKNGQVLYRSGGGRGEKVLDEATGKKLVSMLKLVTEKDGSGKKAAIPGYAVAGKTGTAQKHNTNGKGYAVGKYVASFIGFLPAENPEILTLVVVDEPRPQYYGSEVAAPGFKTVNSMAITALHVLPQESTAPVLAAGQAQPGAPPVQAEKSKMPDVNMTEFAQAKKLLADSGIKFSRYGFGRTVIGQSPKPGVSVSPRDQVYVLLGDKVKGSEIRIYMPDVRGLPIRKAMEVLNGMGIKAKCTGSGYAVTQDPKPGVALQKSRECTVSFEFKDAG